MRWSCPLYNLEIGVPLLLLAAYVSSNQKGRAERSPAASGLSGADGEAAAAAADLEHAVVCGDARHGNQGIELVQLRLMQGIACRIEKA